MINRDVMKKLLTEYFPTANDLRGEVIPGAISLGMKVSKQLVSVLIWINIEKKCNSSWLIPTYSLCKCVVIRFKHLSLMVTGRT